MRAETYHFSGFTPIFNALAGNCRPARCTNRRGGRYPRRVEPVLAAPAKAGLLDGLVEADPTIVGVLVGFLVVGAVLYVVFGMGRRRRKR